MPSRPASPGSFCSATIPGRPASKAISSLFHRWPGWRPWRPGWESVTPSVADPSRRRGRNRRRGYGLLLAGLALWLIVGFLAGWQTERQSAARTTAAIQEAAFADLRQTRHVITGIGLADDADDGDDGDEALRLTLALAGTRSGVYRLTWRLDETLYDVTLLSGERRLDLGPDAAPLDLAVERTRLARRYRETVLDGRPDRVLVDGPFRLRLWLEPLLTEDERQALPARELGNLERGLSELRFETEWDVPMTLDLTRP